MALRNGDDLFRGRETGIIPAADVESLSELRRIAEIARALPEVVAIKIGFSLSILPGLKTAARVVQRVASLPVIYDHQKAGTDIPKTGDLFARRCSKAGADAVIIFPHGGPETLEQYIKGALKYDLIPMVGLEMTHKAYKRSEGGWMADESPDEACAIAISLGVNHFVLPGTRPGTVRRFALGPLHNLARATILMPGIGSQGGSIATAFAAAAPHRRFAIIGSAIYDADDPQKALKAFAKEMQE
jgi:orotidine-5'-phosphate decarboxylase